MDTLENIISRLVSDARDLKRPTIESVLGVIESAFDQMQIAVRQTAAGPSTWIWEDDEMAGVGLPRYYVLSTSNSEGVEGYPLFTIRQAYSVKFDTWISFSCLVLGPDAEAITRSIALTMTHHAGSFAGVKYIASTISANSSSTMAGMIAVQQLLESPPPIITQESISEAIDGFQAGPEAGKMVN